MTEYVYCEHDYDRMLKNGIQPGFGELKRDPASDTYISAENYSGSQSDPVYEYLESSTRTLARAYDCEVCERMGDELNPSPKVYFIVDDDIQSSVHGLGFVRIRLDTASGDKVFRRDPITESYPMGSVCTTTDDLRGRNSDARTVND